MAGSPFVALDKANEVSDTRHMTSLDPKYTIAALVESAKEDPSPTIAVMVTKFDRLKVEVMESNEAGIMVKKLTSDSTHSEGTVLFYPWHQVDHIVISTPEGMMSDDIGEPRSGAV